VCFYHPPHLIISISGSDNLRHQAYALSGLKFSAIHSAGRCPALSAQALLGLASLKIEHCILIIEHLPSYHFSIPARRFRRA